MSRIGAATPNCGYCFKIPHHARNKPLKSMIISKHFVETIEQAVNVVSEISSSAMGTISWTRTHLLRLDFASLYGIYTVDDENNESDIIKKQMKYLGRRKSNPVLGTHRAPRVRGQGSAPLIQQFSSIPRLRRLQKQKLEITYSRGGP